MKKGRCFVYKAESSLVHSFSTLCGVCWWTYEDLNSDLPLIWRTGYKPAVLTVTLYVHLIKMTDTLYQCARYRSRPCDIHRVKMMLFQLS